MKKQDKKARDRFLTLNHNENSNKNININISYNLGHLHSPFHRRLQTENYNPNNSLNSNDPRSTTGIKGKKIDNSDVDYPFEQNRLLHNSLSKESSIHRKMRTQQAQEECEISIKVIKKKKPLISNQIPKGQLNGKLSKNKTIASIRAKKRLHTQQNHTGPSTTTNKINIGNQKNFFSAHQNMSKNNDFQQLTKLYKDNRRKSRSCSKEHSQSRKKLKSGDRKRTIQQQKDLFEEMARRIKKNRESKDSISKKQVFPMRSKKSKGEKLRTETSHNFKKDKKKLIKSKSLQKAPRKKKPSCAPEQRFSLMNPPRKSLDKHLPARPKTTSQYLPKYDIEPLIMARVMNSSLMSDSIKMSELTSKELSDRRQLELMQQTMTLTLNRHSVELTSGLREMREMENNNKIHLLSLIPEESSIYSNLPQEHISIMNKAATLIKQRWQEFRREKVIQYYTNIFQKNQSIYLQEEVSGIFVPKMEDEQEDVDVVSYKGSFDNENQDEQQQYTSTPFKNRYFEDLPNTNKELALDLKSEKFIKAVANIELNEEYTNIPKPLQHKIPNALEKNDEEQESQFDINKYQGLVERSLEDYKNTQQSCLVEFSKPVEFKYSLLKEEASQIQSDKEDIHKFKQQQLEQWNHINTLINRQLNQNQMDPHVLLQELMKQSELNKKWIQESCEASLRNEKSSSPHNSQAESRSSQRSNNYRTLFQEKGIADRLKRNSQNIKQLLCNTYEIDKSERNLSRRSNSVEDLQDKEPHDKSERISKGGNSSKVDELMTYEMMNDDDSEEGGIAFYTRKNKEQSELIDQFLDCGLNQCGLEDLPYLLVNDSVKVQSKPQEQPREDEQLRRRSQNIPVNGDKALLRQQILRPPQLPVQIHELQEQQYSDEILVKITNNQEPRSILIDDDSLPQSFDEEDYGNNEPISRLFHQQRFSKHGIFESIYHMLLEEFSIEIAHKNKFERDFFNCFSNNKLKINREKGIRTSYASIKAYLVNFIDYLMNHPQEKAEVFRNINTRLGPTSTQMLYYLRLQDSYSECKSDETEDEIVIIIPYQTFQRFQFYLDRQQSEDYHCKGSNLQGYTFNWHRALFEGLNEALDQQRPFGIQGQPYVWEIEPRIKNITITEQTLQKHLEFAASKVLQVGSFLGGIIFDKQDSPYGLILSEDHRMQINEDRLSRILATELYETEESWIYYNDQKLELMLQLSSLIYQRVMFEAATDINKIRRRRVFIPQPSMHDSNS